MDSKARLKNCKILLLNEKIDVSQGVKFVSSPKCGAINTFSGIIRNMDRRQNENELEPIIGIYYEAYQAMAIEQIATIINDVIFDIEKSRSIDPNCRVFVSVRLGFVPVGEESLIICVSSTNRSFSHKATMTILEKIKSLVVIWKKIYFGECDTEWADASKSEAYWLKCKNDMNIHT